MIQDLSLPLAQAPHYHFLPPPRVSHNSVPFASLPSILTTLALAMPGSSRSLLHLHLYGSPALPSDA